MRNKELNIKLQITSCYPYVPSTTKLLGMITRSQLALEVSPLVVNMKTYSLCNNQKKKSAPLCSEEIQNYFKQRITSQHKNHMPWIPVFKINKHLKYIHIYYHLRKGLQSGILLVYSPLLLMYISVAMNIIAQTIHEELSVLAHPTIPALPKLRQEIPSLCLAWATFSKTHISDIDVTYVSVCVCVCYAPSRNSNQNF